MAEAKTTTVEELQKELESEREKIRRLEELLSKEEAEVAKKEGLLNELYQRIMLEGLTDKEEISRMIGKEQYEALSYHLAKEHEKRLELEKKVLEDEGQLKTKSQKLAEDGETIQKDEQKINELEAELSKERKKRIELEKELFKRYAIPDSGSEVEEFFDDFDLNDLETPTRAQPQVQQHPVHSRVTVKDLIKLLLRINRMKAIDASIMLNTTKESILRLARPLVAKGYIEVENAQSNDPTLRALKKLLSLKRR